MARSSRRWTFAPAAAGASAPSTASWRASSGRRQADRRRRALAGAGMGVPVELRQALSTALEAEELIAGAYAARRGRICPALAAFRRGARPSVGAFPGAWDNFARARRPRL